MGTKNRIGIKYCGGCNPVYERTEMVQRLQSQLKDQFLFFLHDEPDIDRVVLLNGCHRACAAQDVNQSAPHYSVTEENDFRTLINWLKS